MIRNHSDGWEFRHLALVLVDRQVRKHVSVWNRQWGWTFTCQEKPWHRDTPPRDTPGVKEAIRWRSGGRIHSHTNSVRCSEWSTNEFRITAKLHCDAKMSSCSVWQCGWVSLQHVLAVGWVCSLVRRVSDWSMDTVLHSARGPSKVYMCLLEQ